MWKCFRCFQLNSDQSEICAGCEKAKEIEPVAPTKKQWSMEELVEVSKHYVGKVQNSDEDIETVEGFLSFLAEFRSPPIIGD